MADFEAPDREPPQFWVEFGTNLEIGDVETLPAGSQAYVRNAGTAKHQIWDIGIPEGEQGVPGQDAKIIIRRL